MASLEIPGLTGGDDVTCPSLTFMQRMIGFGVCCVLASIFSIVSVVGAFNADWTLFAVMTAISQIFALGGTFFLAGPKKQALKMAEEGRWIWSLIYILSLIFVFVAAFAIKSAGAVIAAVIIMYIAFVAYCISQFPGGCTICKRLVGL